MNTFNLILLLLIIGATIASPVGNMPMTPSHFTIVDKAYQTLDSDWSTIRDLYSDQATLKFCWGGANPDCVDGGVDEILLPFHKALKTFKVKNQVLTGKNAKVVSLHWSNYMETPDGCGEVTTGIATLQFDENDKVIHHVSLSDDAIQCVPQYLEKQQESTHVE